jgi:DNA-binding transcriptional ArsR family regulator
MSPRAAHADAEGQPVFRALADPTRRRLLDELRRGPRTTGELVAAHPEMTRFGVMAHLDVLEQAGLVIVTRQGRHRTNHLNPVPIAEIYRRWMHPYAEAPAHELLALKHSIEQKKRRSTVDDIRTPIAAEIEAEVTISAGVEEVWTALTDDIGRWWSHSFKDEPYAIVLEPFIGGRFYEQFDESGAGALYATVTYVEPYRVLRTSGSMGMPGARQYVKTYRLEPAGDATVVRTTASALGDIGPELLTGYRDGGQALLEALKTYVEKIPA